VSPEPLDPIPKSSQPFAISRYGVVVEVSLHDSSQPLTRFPDWGMHPDLELLFDCLQLRPHAFACRFAAYGEIAFPVSPTTMGETQKIERLRFSSPSVLPIVLGLAPERDQPGLVRM
jgi:hypothetical protein